MKQLFKKKQFTNRDVSKRESFVIAACNRMIRFLAQYLNQKTAQFRPSTIALLLLSLCIIGAISFSLLGFYSFKEETFFQTQPVRIPAISRLFSPLPKYDYTVQRIQHFHHYMDSLHSADSLRYDSILRARPHLMDSVMIVEQLIHQ